MAIDGSVRFRKLVLPEICREAENRFRSCAPDRPAVKRCWKRILLRLIEIERAPLEE